MSDRLRTFIESRAKKSFAELDEDGAAWRDGQLQFGDRLLAVNRSPVSSLAEVRECLRRASGSSIELLMAAWSGASANRVVGDGARDAARAAERPQRGLLLRRRGGVGPARRRPPARRDGRRVREG